MKSLRNTRLVGASFAVASLCLLTACGGGQEASTSDSLPPKEDRPQTAPQGNATPVESPASANPAGEKVALPAELASASDVEAAGNVLAVRSGVHLLIGTLEQIKDGKAESLNISEKCGDITATGDHFVVPCPIPLDGGAGGGVIYVVDAKNPNLENKRSAPMKFTSAALTTGGEVIGGSSEEKDVFIFRGDDSSNAKKVSTSRLAHQIVSVPIEGEPDGVVFIDRSQTAIQGVDFENNRQGAALRMGVGVGQIARGEDGVVFAADTLGDQLGVYTETDVLRLHQTLSIDDGPWSLAWDTKNKVVWAASNGTNQLAAYDISTGVPVKKGSLSTIANVRNVAMLDDGSAVLVSDSEKDMQVLTASDLSGALK